jgi:hypothetical protein
LGPECFPHCRVRIVYPFLHRIKRKICWVRALLPLGGHGAGVAATDTLVEKIGEGIRETSNNRFTPQTRRSKIPQIRALFKAAKTCVFFTDDKQVVRPAEIGSTDYIKIEAEKLNLEVRVFRPEAQFLCAGSDAFAVDQEQGRLDRRKTETANLP